MLIIQILSDCPQIIDMLSIRIVRHYVTNSFVQIRVFATRNLNRSACCVLRSDSFGESLLGFHCSNKLVQICVTFADDCVKTVMPTFDGIARSWQISYRGVIRVPQIRRKERIGSPPISTQGASNVL